MDLQPSFSPLESAELKQQPADSGRLNFVRLTIQSFGFLLQLGFRVARCDATLVRFETDVVFVNVYHGRLSYQLGVEVGHLGAEELYSLHEVLSALSPDSVAVARFQAATEKELERCLDIVARTMEDHCMGLLTDAKGGFDVLRESVAESRRLLTQQAQYGAIADKADLAWERQDWRQASRLYILAEPALSKIQRRRLGYLQKKGSPGECRDESG